MLTWIDDILNGLVLNWLPIIGEVLPTGWSIWWVIAAIALIGAAVLLPASVRRLRGTPWRWLALATLLLAVANPVLQRELREPLANIVYLFEDHSASMRIGERAAEAGAAGDALVAELQTLAEAQDRSIDVRRIRFGGERNDAGTQLRTQAQNALSEVSRSQLAGVFVVSDGQINDLALNDLSLADGGGELDVGQLGLPAGVPLHGLVVGSDPALVDRRLTVVTAPRFGLVGEPVEAVVRVEDSNDSNDDSSSDPTERVIVEVRREGTLVARLPVQKGVDQTIRLTPDTGGRNLFELSVASPTLGEVTQINNRAAFVVNGVRERLRVLLVSGSPHQAERAWRNLLKSDPSVDLVHFTILRPADRRDTTPVQEMSLIAFPVRELFLETLDEFDLVIFDQYPRRGILPSAYFQNIANYVANGGALFVASGPTYASPRTIYASPLQAVLPAAPTGVVTSEPFVPQITELGGRHPMTNRLLAGQGVIDADEPQWGRWLRLIETNVTRGEVLMDDGNDNPLLVVERYQQGRVVQLLSDHLWLWARGFEGGGPQAELLRRAAHWAMSEPELEEERLVGTARDGVLTIERRSLTPGDGPEGSVMVTLVDPTGAERQVTLEDQGDGRTVARVETDVDGVYTVQDERAERVTRIPVGVINPVEFLDPLAKPDLLAPWVTASAGWLGDVGSRPSVSFSRSANAGDLTVVDRRAYRVLGLSSFRLMPAWLGLLLALGFLLIAWWREGR